MLLILYPSSCRASEENDLWLLLSSYEDIGITTKDLAFFLVTHGYNAEPASNQSYVTVKLKEGKEVYITPNGASPRLGDLWMTPYLQDRPRKGDIQRCHQDQYHLRTDR